MANAVNAGDFFESVFNKQTAVPFTVALDDLDSQEIYLDPRAVKSFEIPTGILFQRVAKGAPYPINIGFSCVFMEGTAICDGYLLKEEGDNRWKFMEKAAFDAIFCNRHQPVERQKIVIPARKAFKCVVLEEDTTFGFLNETFLATTGMVLYENPSDPDGYTVTSQMRFFQDYLILR